MPDIVTLDELRTYPDFLGATLTTEQILALDSLRKDVEAAVVDVIGYNPAQATYTEFYPQKRTPSAFDTDDRMEPFIDPQRNVILERGNVYRQILALKNIPVRSITSIYENASAWATGSPGGDWPSSTLLAPSSYRLQLEEAGICKTGFVIRGGAWTDAIGCIKVTYVAGYTAAELTAVAAHVKAAVKMAVSWNWANAKLRQAIISGTGRLESGHSITDYSVNYVDPAALGMTAFGEGSGAGSGLLPQSSLNLLGNFVNLGEYF